MSQLGEPLLGVQNLRVERAGRKLVDDANFALYAGKIIAIVGPNGAGKSTLLKSLAGILPTVGGEISWGGSTALDARSRAKMIGYVPQSFSLAAPITVQRFVISGLFPELGRFGAVENQRERILEALRLVNCAELEDRQVHTLSGGEAQRVLLAAALVHKPKVLLLDEPGSLLDLKHDQELYALLKELVSSGERAVLVVSHDLNASSLLADEILAMKRGRQEYYGAASGFMRAEVVRQVFDFEPIFVAHPRSGMPMILPAQV